MDTETKPRLCVEEKNPGDAGTTIRDATREEVMTSSKLRGQLEWLREEAKRIQARIHELEDGCKHTVIRDEEGFPHDVRLCHACGATTGMV